MRTGIEIFLISLLNCYIVLFHLLTVLLQIFQFFLELMKVPRVESKLRVFAFTINFTSQVHMFIYALYNLFNYKLHS